MFGYFKRKLFHVNCPVCLREFSIKFNPEEVRKYNYKYKEGAGVVFTLECDFCGGEGKIVQYENGDVETVDHKRFRLEEKHEKEIDKAKEDLRKVREKLEENIGSMDLRNERNILESKIKNLDKQYRKDKREYDDYVKEYRQLWAEELKHI